jgi:hypothetical protein
MLLKRAQERAKHGCHQGHNIRRRRSPRATDKLRFAVHDISFATGTSRQRCDSAEAWLAIF